jgi:hypothetical protein
MNRHALPVLSCQHVPYQLELTVSGYSDMKLLSSRLVSKNFDIMAYKTVILPVFCMGVKLGLSH